MSNDTMYYLSWPELHNDARNLAQQLIDQHPKGLPWKGIIGIARGGLIPAAILARELDIRMMDTLCISSYDDNDEQTDTEIIKSIDGDGEGFLLVDDLVDTGNTAKVARQLLPKAHLVTLYAKPAGIDHADAYQREFAQDTWIHFPWDSSVEEGNYDFSLPLVKQQKTNDNLNVSS